MREQKSASSLKQNHNVYTLMVLENLIMAVQPLITTGIFKVNVNNYTSKKTQCAMSLSVL